MHTNNTNSSITSSPRTVQNYPRYAYSLLAILATNRGCRKQYSVLGLRNKDIDWYPYKAYGFKERMVRQLQNVSKLALKIKG